MASHLEEQQEVENFKYYWRTWGKWVFALFVLAALGYLGYVLYQGHLKSQNQEASAALAQMVEDVQNKKGEAVINADLKALQQDFPNSISAAQATLMVGASEFDKGHYDVAEGHLKWVLEHQKAPLIQALATQRLAVVQLQQKKYDDALTTLNAPVAPAFEPLILETKGDVLTAAGKTKEAAEAYEQALNKTPEDSGNRELLQLKQEQVK